MKKGILILVILMVVVLSGCEQNVMSCGEGTISKDGTCISQNDSDMCPSGFTEEDGLCLQENTTICGEGTQLIDNTCEVINDITCGNGTTLVDGSCIVNTYEIPIEITMEDIDDLMHNPNVQMVDLRSFDDKVVAGYIEGFDFIPFFGWLESRDILVRTDNDWAFEQEDILNEERLRALFDSSKTIVLMCGSGTRAGFVKAALVELGYTDVHNVGGILSYHGDYRVLGDGYAN